MIPITINVQYLREGVKNAHRCKLTLDTRVGDAVSRLMSELNLPAQDGGRAMSYYLVANRQELDEASTFMECNVQEGEIVQLVARDPNATLGQLSSSRMLNRLGGKGSLDALPVHATLTAKSGQEYKLQRTRALIGRADSRLGYPPETLDADLTDLDPGRTVSRPHALIVYSNGEFTIRDLYSNHGLMVNGETVSPSKAIDLQSGDVVALGDVELVFRVG